MTPFAPVALTAGTLAAVGLVVAYAVNRPADAPVAAMAPAPIPAPPETATLAPAPAPPTFDLVRVAPDGAALVAGKAEPGATVTIYAEGAPLAEVEADANGEFAAIFDAEPSTAPKALTLGLETEAGDEIASEDVVVLLPAAPEAAPPAEAAAADPAARTLVAKVAPDPPAEAAAEVPPEPEVAATAVLRGGVAEVAPTEGAPPDGLTLASISYGETGGVLLAGQGDAGAKILAYVDDAFARDAEVDADGRWSLELDDVTSGLRRLRIDALDPQGAVTARIETPFQRDTPPPPVQGGPVRITVQPGNNLWTLARIHYGSGVLYTQIHTANQELIRDPSLIYPGQIFVLPGGDGDAAAD